MEARHRSNLSGDLACLLSLQDSRRSSVTRTHGVAEGTPRAAVGAPLVVRLLPQKAGCRFPEPWRRGSSPETLRPLGSHRPSSGSCSPPSRSGTSPGVLTWEKRLRGRCFRGAGGVLAGNGARTPCLAVPAPAPALEVLMGERLTVFGLAAAALSAGVACSGPEVPGRPHTSSVEGNRFLKNFFFLKDKMPTFCSWS